MFYIFHYSFFFFDKGRLVTYSCWYRLCLVSLDPFDFQSVITIQIDLSIFICNYTICFFTGCDYVNPYTDSFLCLLVSSTNIYTLLRVQIGSKNGKYNTLLNYCKRIRTAILVPKTKMCHFVSLKKILFLNV